MEAVGAEAEEGFAEEGPERQQTAGPAGGKGGAPGSEHWTCLGEVVAAGWWGPSSLCWGLEAGSERKEEEQILRQTVFGYHASDKKKKKKDQLYKTPAEWLLKERSWEKVWISAWMKEV